MFEKYNTKDLYFATIQVKYPDNDANHFGNDGLFIIDGNGPIFDTVLLKYKDKYIDLRHPELKIVEQRNPDRKSFVIKSLKPFSEEEEYLRKGKIMRKYKIYKKEKSTIK